MGLMIRGAFVPAGTHVLYGSEHDFGTRAARFFMDPVLPLLMVLIIAALTVAIIVLLVTTVASAVLRSQPDVGHVIDPWLVVGHDPAGVYDNSPYADDAVSAEGMHNGAWFNTGATARWTP
jgi:hypothetical protein